MGMMFNGQQRQLTDPLAGLPIAQAQAPQPSMPIAPQVPQVDPGLVGRIQPTTWQQGGKGWSTVGNIGDVLAALGGKPGVFHDQAQADSQQALANQFKQQQLMIEAWKARNGDKTALQQNYEYLKGQNPQLADQYLRAQANPMALMTDPATGQVGFYPRGGVPGMNMGGDQMPTVGSDAEFNALPSGTQFRDPQGNVRVKP